MPQENTTRYAGSMLIVLLGMGAITQPVSQSKFASSRNLLYFSPPVQLHHSLADSIHGDVKLFSRPHTT
jgi:hypothetical protein